MAKARHDRDFAARIGGTATGMMVSAIALIGTPVLAQTAPPAPPPTVTPAPPLADDSPPPASAADIVVTGIRASLRESINLKRNAQGVVDAISATPVDRNDRPTDAVVIESVTIS